MAIDKVKAAFAAMGMEDRIHEFDESSATVELAAKAVGCDPAQIVKTLSLSIMAYSFAGTPNKLPIRLSPASLLDPR